MIPLSIFRLGSGAGGGCCLFQILLVYHEWSCSNISKTLNNSLILILFVHSLAISGTFRHQKLEHFISAFKMMAFVWMERVFTIYEEILQSMKIGVLNSFFQTTFTDPCDVQDFFLVMIFISSLNDAQGCKIPEYPHAARQPLVQLLRIWIQEFNTFSWLLIIFSQNLQCRGWFCFMMNRRRLSSSSSLSFSSSLPFFAFSLLQRNSGDRLRKSRRASTCIGGFSGTFTRRQSASTAL